MLEELRKRGDFTSNLQVVRKVKNDREVGIASIALLKACAKKKDLHRGISLHGDMLKTGLIGRNRYVRSTLISMYAKCGALMRAREVLFEIPTRDVVSWNALIAGYAQQGKGEDALNCFEHMQSDGISPDSVTFTCILNACGIAKAFDKGKQIHEEIVNKGLLKKHINLGNALVDMYAKCGAFTKAQEVLDDLPFQDVISWNSMIAAYAQQGKSENAMHCFDEMQKNGFSPNAVSFTCILKACGSIGALEKGKQIHEDIVNRALLGKHIELGNSLVDMYAKCGAFTQAKQVLDKLLIRDVASWNALIAGYSQHGKSEDALECLEWMLNDGLSPNAITFTCILKACGIIRALDKGKQIHKEIVNNGLLAKDSVLGTALIGMYAKCGELGQAQEVFEELPIRNVASWSALIGGYVQKGMDQEAVSCFKQMQNEGLSPDSVTFICILRACGNTGAIDKGIQIHNDIVSRGLLQEDTVLGTSLMGMYAKCGELRKAREIFDELLVRDVAAWNALILGYAQQGQSEEALNCFNQMQNEKLSPDVVTLLCVLCACSHSGLVEEGQTYFTDMSNKYGILPVIEHQTCLVNLFGRAGYFDEAMSIMKDMPTFDYPIWIAILGSCQKWGNVKLGKLAFEQAIELDSSYCAAYVLMANTYAAAGMQEDAEMVEAMRLRYVG